MAWLSACPAVMTGLVASGTAAAGTYAYSYRLLRVLNGARQQRFRVFARTQPVCSPTLTYSSSSSSGSGGDGSMGALTVDGHHGGWWGVLLGSTRADGLLEAKALAVLRHSPWLAPRTHGGMGQCGHLAYAEAADQSTLVDFSSLGRTRCNTILQQAASQCAGLLHLATPASVWGAGSTARQFSTTSSTHRQSSSGKEWAEVHKPMILPLLRDLPEEFNKAIDWHYDALVVASNGSNGPDFVIYGPQIVPIEVKYSWSAAATEGVKQVTQGINPNAYQQRQLQEAAAFGVAGLVSPPNQQPQTMRLVAWQSNQKTVLSAGTTFWKQARQQYVNNSKGSIIALEWSPTQNSFMPRGAATNSGNVGQGGAGIKPSAPMDQLVDWLLALEGRHAAVPHSSADPVTPTGQAVTPPKLDLDMVAYRYLSALGMFWLKRQVERDWAQGQPNYTQQSTREMAVWEAVVDVLKGICQLWAVGRGDVKMGSSGREGYPNYTLGFVKSSIGGHSVFTIRGPAACYLQRFVRSRYEARNPQAERAVRDAVQQELHALNPDKMRDEAGKYYTPAPLAAWACREWLAPAVQRLVDAGHDVVLVDPASGAGIFPGCMQEVANAINSSSGSGSGSGSGACPTVTVQAFELSEPDAKLATTLGCSTKQQDSLAGIALQRSHYTGPDTGKKLVMVGNPPWRKHGPNPDIAVQFLLQAHQLEADEIIYLLPADIFVDDSNTRPLQGKLRSNHKPWAAHHVLLGSEKLTANGWTFDQAYDLVSVSGWRSRIFHLRSNASTADEDILEAMDPLLSLHTSSSKLASSLQPDALPGAAAPVRASSQSALDVSESMRRALRGQNTIKGEGFPVVLVHARRRPEAAHRPGQSQVQHKEGQQQQQQLQPGGSSGSLIAQLEAVTVPLYDVQRCAATEGLEVVNCHCAVNLKQVKDKYGVFSVLPAGANIKISEQPSTSRYGLWVFAGRTGVEYNINSAVKWSLQGHDHPGLHAAVQTREQLLVAAHTTAVSQVWQDLSNPTKSSSSPQTRLTQQQLGTLAGFLGRSQPLVDPRDFFHTNKYLQDALHMLMVVTAHNRKWWKSKKVTLPPPVYALVPPGAKQLLPGGMVGKGGQNSSSIGLALPSDEEQEMRQRQQALNKAIRSSSSSSSSNLAAALGIPVGTILFDNPELVRDLQGAYQAFFEFWDGAYQTKGKFHEKRKVAADQHLKPWMVSYMRCLLEQVAR